MADGERKEIYAYATPLNTFILATYEGIMLDEGCIFPRFGGSEKLPFERQKQSHTAHKQNSHLTNPVITPKPLSTHGTELTEKPDK